MPNLMNNWLRRLREKARPGETITSIAKELSIKKEYLSKIERGTLKCPSKEVLDKLLDAYGCSKAMRYALGLLMSEGGGPDDGVFQDESHGLFDVPPEPSLRESWSGEARFGDRMTPGRLGENLHLQFYSKPGDEKFRRICAYPLARDALSSNARYTFALTPQSLITAMADGDHWINTESHDYQRLLTLLLDEPGRVFITSWNQLPKVDVVFVDDVLAFFPVATKGQGELASAGFMYSMADTFYGPAFNSKLPPVEAVVYASKLREQARLMREACSVLDDSVVEREGREIRVLPKVDR